MSGGPADPFEQAYLRGVPAAVAAPVPVPRSGPPPLALRGCIVAEEGILDDGYLQVGPDGRLVCVQRHRPEGSRIIETGGVILPGLIDLHGHPEFNVFAPWEPPQHFANRYQWRASDIYQRLIRDPEHVLLKQLPALTQGRYAEIRALVGGVTAIQGSSTGDNAADQPIVRHVDLWNFGQHRGRSMIDLPLVGDPGVARLQQVLDLIATGEVDAFYLHLAEGTAADPTSAAEFPRLVQLNGLTAATVIIHGTALSGQQLGALKDAGAKLVWSPQSNLRLYGQTTNVAAALAAGVPVAIGADWAPSGSPSLLAELKVARRVLAEQGVSVTPRQVVEMVTTQAAAISGLSGHLGSLAAGCGADVVVLERRRADPWENIVEADPSWVDLVLVAGHFCYGRADWAAGVLPPESAPWQEPVRAWGKRMVLDTNAGVAPSGTALPTLAQLRTALVAVYPQVGPIFA